MNKLEQRPAEEVLAAGREAAVPLPENVQREMEAVWERALGSKPLGIDADDIAVPHTEKRILHWELVPLIPNTYWCVPTSQTMILGFWDNYVKGRGTVLGYGRLIGHWFEHNSQCHDPVTGRDPACGTPGTCHNNVPDLIDQLIDPTKKPHPTWRDGFKDLPEFVKISCDYDFKDEEIEDVNARNDWRWQELREEIDAGRPAMWCFGGHAVVAIGYRISQTGQKSVICLDTYGTTVDQKLEEHRHSECNKLYRIMPGGGTGYEHLIIISPDGGETLHTSEPFTINWYVWGNTIQKTTLSFSADGGYQWMPIASNVETNPGWNSHVWMPPKTAKGRIRVQGYTTQNKYIAGDGSQTNFAIQTNPKNYWSNWASMGNPLPVGPTGGDGVDAIAVGQNQDGRLELLAVATDGNLWHRYQHQPNKGWVGWDNMGHPPGGVTLRPSLAVGKNQDGQLEVLAIGSDNALWHRYQRQPNSAWVGWDSMGRPPGGLNLFTLTIGQNQDGRLAVFALDLENRALWYRQQQWPNGPWTNWMNLGKPPGGVGLYTLATGRNQDGRLEIFAGGGIKSDEFEMTNTALWHCWQQQPSGSWSNWASMGSPPNTTTVLYPVVEQNQDGRLEVFTVGGSGTLWHRWQVTPNNGWSRWASMGTAPSGFKFHPPLDVSRNKDGRLELATIGTQGTGPSSVFCPWHRWQVTPNDGWSRWQMLGSLPGRSFESLVIGQNQDGRLEVFGNTSEDKAVWQIWQR